MKQNNSDILQLFARRISVCRHKVSAETLAQYLKNGEFGFSFDKSGDHLITNDTVYAAEIEQLTDHIRAIINEPHISLKKDRVVRNVSVASKMDTRSVNETYKDEKLWRVKRENGDMAPEFIHTYVYEDDLAIYENRFVCYLLDITLESVNKKLKELCLGIQTLNRKVDSNGKNLAYSSDVYVQYTDEVEQCPVISSAKDPNIFAIRSLMKSKSILSALMTHELYVICQKAGPFHIHTLHLTNLLMKDQNYNFCYMFYTYYLNESRYITSESNKYTNFVLVHILSALIDQGFALSKNSEDVLIGENVTIKLQNVIFEKGLFQINLSQQSANEVIFEVTELADNCSAKYLFQIVTPDKPLELGNQTLEEYAKELDSNRAADITRVFLICDQNAVSDFVIPVIAGKSDICDNLAEAIKSITIVAEGLSFLHKKYCPVCGSTYLAPEGTDYSCSACNTLYHTFNYEFRDLIWIKRLPDVVERKAKTEKTEEILIQEPEEEIKESLPDVEEVKEEPAEEEPASIPTMTSASRKVISKSFEGKLSQASQEQKAFYSDLKNYLLSFKRTNSRISWSYDSFNVGRNVVCRLAFRGQTMVAYFALDPKDYVDSKYFVHDMNDKKKYEKTPFMVKVKSARGVKYAKELINVVCEGLAPKKNFVAETYDFPYLSDSELMEKGLMKETFVNI